MADFGEKRRAAMDQMLRDEVYEKAVQVLTREGHSALTMDLLAKKVGVSRPTLYNHFADRDHVLIYVEERLLAPIRERIDSEVWRSDLPPDMALSAAMRITFESISNDRALFVALFRRDVLQGARFESQARRRAEFLGDLRACLEEGIATGLFNDHRADIIAEMLMGAMFSFIDAMIYDGIERSCEEVMIVFDEIILVGLLKQ